MAQNAKVIDLTRGYVPGDPNSFPQNMSFTEGEDRPEKEPPILAFEGYNFMPTIYGYRSYFGLNSHLNVRSLESRAQFVLLMQTVTFENILIALCEDGIWTAFGDGSVPVWVHQVKFYPVGGVGNPEGALTYDTNIYQEWTYCVIENVLYMYQQQRPVVWKTGLDDLVVPAIAEIPAVPAVTIGGSAEIPGTLMESPLEYATTYLIEALDTGGDADTFLDGFTYNLYTAFVDGSGNLSAADYDTGIDLIMNGDEGAIRLRYLLPAHADLVGVSFRLYIEDMDGVGDLYKKDYAIVTDVQTDIVITTFSDWTLLTEFLPENEDLLVGTIPAVPPTVIFPEIPAIPAVAEQTKLDTLVITSGTPTFLNMVGQMGIFKAGTRLGMWDSANSVSWSSNLDLYDFTPSLENLAGNRIFGDTIGRIVTIKASGEGYVIYSTKSITGVTFMQEGTLLWDGRAILTNVGISFSRAVTYGSNDTDHIVFTTSGLYMIGKYNPITGKHENQPIMQEISDYLLEDRNPVYMTTSQSRYIFFSLINPAYIYGLLQCDQETIDPYKLDLSWYRPAYEITEPTEILPAITIYEEIWSEFIAGETPDDFIRNRWVDPDGEEHWAFPPEESENYDSDEPDRSGPGTTKRSRMDNRKWIPLYETKMDRMDVRYYAWWKKFRATDETEGLLDYENNAPILDSVELPDFDQTLLDSDLNAQRPTSPPDSARYGRLVTYDSTELNNGTTMPGIRAFPGVYGGDLYDNCQNIVYNQEDEWESFKLHQTKNKDRLEERELEEVTTSYLTSTVGGSAPANTDVTVDTTVGYILTGEGNREWLFNEGPYEFSAREIIYRNTFTEKYKVEKRVRTQNVYTHLDYDPTVVDGQWRGTITYKSGNLYYDNGLGSYPGYTAYSAGSITSAEASGSTQALMTTALLGMVGSHQVLTLQGGLNTFGDRRNQEWIFTAPVSSGTNYPYTSATITNWYNTGETVPAAQLYPSDSGFANPVITITHVGAGPVNRKVSTVTTSYVITRIVGDQLGYSELRHTVKYWDLVEPSAYGNWKLIKRVEADYMNPLIWEDHYPEDLGSGFWQKGGNASQNGIDLRWRTVGNINMFEGLSFMEGNPNYPARTDGLEDGTGIDGLKYYSYIVTGVYRVGKYIDEVFTEGSYLRADYVPGQYIPGIYKLGAMNKQSISITLPGATFNLQTGSIEVAYPTFVGALVYDMQLKKWGKMKGEHLVVLDINPVNTGIGQGVNYTALSTDSGILDTDGMIYTFDSAPVDSFIRYGKIGYYRLGMTEAYETKVQFRSPSGAVIAVEGSFDGRALSSDRSYEQFASQALDVTVYPDLSARWYSIKISGNYDLTGLEFRGKLVSRR